jgi:hypothetical protein
VGYDDVYSSQNPRSIAVAFYTIKFLESLPKKEEQMAVSALLVGVVVENRTPSCTGSYLYSDFVRKDGIIQKNSLLNNLSQIPFVGILAGIARIALGIIHTLGHLLTYLIEQDRGHLYHAAKGGCEILRGGIEAIPLIGRIFAWAFMAPFKDIRCWWMLKMYNPDSPDGLDCYMEKWDHWKRDNPQLYVKA